MKAIEMINERINNLNKNKKEVLNEYPTLEEDSWEQRVLAERNMNLDVEINFLTRLLKLLK